MGKIRTAWNWKTKEFGENNKNQLEQTFYTTLYITYGRQFQVLPL